MIAVFLDTSAVIAALASQSGGSREILKLGEGRAIRIVVSADVLREAGEVVGRKLPEALGDLAATLVQARIETVPSARRSVLQSLAASITYAPDRTILAAAVQARVDYLVMFDRKHLIGNRQLQAGVLFPIGTAGDFLAWFRTRLSAING